MKKRSTILIILFGLTAVLLFASILQQTIKVFKFDKLFGYFEPTPKPVLTFDACCSGDYQRQMEKYLKENFGFHEPLIRMYNQWAYDWYKVTSNKDVAVGKDDWLYHIESILQYFGNFESRTNKTDDEVRDMLDIQARSLYKVNAILKEYGVHLLTFTLPTKSYIYPEHLRKQPVGDTTFNVATYFEQALCSYGLPHINMTPWFKQMQDTCGISLFYSKDSHWASGAVLATDSLLHYMEQLGGQRLTHIQRGNPYPVAELSPHEIDLERLLNLARPLEHEPLYEYPVHYVRDENTQFPTVLFLGTSFYWRMTRRINFDALFSSRDFLYYESIFYSNREQSHRSGYDLDHLHELLLHDYVVLFRDGPQLYHSGYLFPTKWLISLCISDERLKEKTADVADSLLVAWKPETQLDSAHCRHQAKTLVQNHPDMFEELRGDGIPTCRNPRIQQILAEKEILSNRAWRFLLTAKARNDSLDVAKTFQKEANNVLNNRDLIRNYVYFTTYDYFDFLVEEALADICRNSDVCITNSETSYSTVGRLAEQALDTIEKQIRQHAYDDDTLMMMACAMDAFAKQLGKEDVLPKVRKKADEKKISIDQAFRNNVVWCYRNSKDNWHYMTQDALVKAFDVYLIERKMRNNKEALDNLLQKHRELNLPFRVIINRNIEWVRKKNVKQ